MKKYFIILFLFFFSNDIFAQLPDEIKDRLEKYIENSETQEDYSVLLDQIMQYYDQPFNLNTCTLEELMQFPLLEPQQAIALVNHRKLFGEFIDLAELQVVGLDIETIKLIQPFVSVELSAHQKVLNFEKELKFGQKSFVTTLKYAEPNSLPSSVIGSEWSQNLRLRYFGNRYSFGINADKDAGEKYWNKGPDFITAHIAVKNIGKLNYAVLGDYILHFGQGLVIGSGFGMGKGANVMNVKRGRQPVREYRGINEFQFFRGAAAQYSINKKLQFVTAVSVSKIDATLNLDSLKNQLQISNFDFDGYHRTSAELDKKNNTTQTLFYGMGQYSSKAGNIQIGVSRFQYSNELIPSNDLYKKYYPQQNDATYIQIAQNHSIKNVHIFSEFAIDLLSQKKAIIAGMFFPLGTKIETVILYRNYEPGFVARYSTAFGQNSQNEHGMYTGIKYVLHRKLWVSMYQDLYEQPWLQYTTDGKAYNSDVFFQIDKMFTKKSGTYLRVRRNISTENNPDETRIQHLLERNATNLRWHLKNEIASNMQIEFRLEGNVVHLDNKSTYQGSLMFFELTQKLLRNKISLNTRYTLFNTENYNNRIYAFENQLLYDFSSAAFYGKGFSYYILLSARVYKGWKLAARYALTQSIKPGEIAMTQKQNFGIQIINLIK